MPLRHTGRRRRSTRRVTQALEVRCHRPNWQVDTLDELAQARDTLRQVNGYTGEASHGATKSLYGADPDGNEFEVMWMVPREAWGEYEHTAPVEPLDLEADLRRWSGVATAGELAARQVAGSPAR